MQRRALDRFHLRRTAVLGGWLLLLGLIAAAAQAQRAPFAATLTAAHGAVTVRRSGAATFTAAAVKAQLAAGDIVQTGPGSRAVLVFSDGSQVKLNAGSLLLIPAAGRPRLQQGELYARTAPGRGA